MKNILIIFFLLMCIRCTAQVGDWRYSALAPAKPISDPQLVTEKFATAVGISGSEKLAIEKAVQSMEIRGIYSKLHAFWIGKYWSSGHLLNLVNPLAYDGAFRLSQQAGTVAVTSSGIQFDGGDTVSTNMVNDLATNAPNIGAFWVADTNVALQFVSSRGSPFVIEPRYTDGKAYVNIWANPSGMTVPADAPGFRLAQRISDTVQIWHGATKYYQSAPVNSQNPTGNYIYIHYNGSYPFTIKIFGITDGLTDQQALDLNDIITTLISDLGI